MRALWCGSAQNQYLENVLVGLQSRWPETRVKETTNLEQALAFVKLSAVDLVLVSLGENAGVALQFIRAARGSSNLPLLAVANGDTGELARARALYQGADAVIYEPCHPLEVQANTLAVLRRLPGKLTGLEEGAQLGDLQIFSASGEVYLRGEPVRLTPTEFRLLQALAQRLGTVATFDYLARALWGAETDGAVLRKHVWHLRHKLEDDPQRPTRIVSVPSLGYRLLVHHGGSLKPARRVG